MLNLDSIVVKNENSIESEIDGQIVLMNLDNNEYYSLDSVGSDIWKMLSDKIMIKDIISHLLEEYKVESPVIGFEKTV